MKTLILASLLLVSSIITSGLSANEEDLMNIYTGQDQTMTRTATLKSASRLFREKDDLTSVIMILPAGSVVTLLSSDSTYFKVDSDGNKGYIFRKDAVPDKTPVKAEQTQPSVPVKEPQPPENATDSRYRNLENKYGSAMASRLYSGKIWKGMNAEMVRDSWGRAAKINRVINGNEIREEWIYNTTWLYFENNTLLEWGPVKK